MAELSWLTGLIAFLTPILLLGLLAYLARGKRLSPKLILISFSIGFVSAPLALLVFYLVDFTPVRNLSADRIIQLILYSFCVVALVEETCKFVLLRFWIYPLKKVNGVLQGVIMATALSLGFAAIENVFYVVDEPGFRESLKIAFSRLLTAVPAHAAFGIVMGYYVGKAKLYPKYAKEHLAYGWISSILLHGLYDFSLFLNNRYLFAFVAGLILFYSIRLLLLAIRQESILIAGIPDPSVLVGQDENSKENE